MTNKNAILKVFPYEIAHYLMYLVEKDDILSNMKKPTLSLFSSITDHDEFIYFDGDGESTGELRFGESDDLDNQMQEYVVQSCLDLAHWNYLRDHLDIAPVVEVLRDMMSYDAEYLVRDAGEITDFAAFKQSLTNL